MTGNETPGSPLVAALAQLQLRLPKVGEDKTAKVQPKEGRAYSYQYADPLTGQCFCGGGWHDHGCGPFCGPEPQTADPSAPGFDPVGAVGQFMDAVEADRARRAEWNGADEGDYLRHMDDYGIDTPGRTFGHGLEAL
jgi:hypothetical protein